MRNDFRLNVWTISWLSMQDTKNERISTAPSLEKSIVPIICQQTLTLPRWNLLWLEREFCTLPRTRRSEVTNKHNWETGDLFLTKYNYNFLLDVDYLIYICLNYRIIEIPLFPLFLSSTTKGDLIGSSQLRVKLCFFAPFNFEKVCHCGWLSMIN